MRHIHSIWALGACDGSIDRGLWQTTSHTDGQRPRNDISGLHDQNAFIERFNKSFRVEMLDANLFNSISEVQMAADEWLMDYNEYRPHESLGDMPPAAFLPRIFERNVSSFKSST